MEHTTYNMNFALASFDERFEVYCTHPDGEDTQLRTIDEIIDAEGHLFLIKSEDN